jgi:hypothetical protein
MVEVAGNSFEDHSFAAAEKHLCATTGESRVLSARIAFEDEAHIAD